MKIFDINETCGELYISIDIQTFLDFFVVVKRGQNRKVIN